MLSFSFPNKLLGSRASWSRGARNVGLAMVLATMVVPRMAFADDKELASTHFNRGVQLYRAKSFDGALAEFKRAYELTPSSKVLFNIGQLQFELHEWSASLRTLEQYLAESGDAVPADRKATVTQLIEKAKEFVGHIVITVEHQGDVTLDEASIGTGPFSKKDITVDPGKHRLTYTPPTGGLVVKSLEIASGDRALIELAPPPPVVDTPPPVVYQKPVVQSPPPKPLGPPPSRTPAWIALGTTGILAAGTVTTAIFANGAQKALDRQLGDIPLDDGNVRGRRRDVKTASLATDILGASTIVGGIITTYLFISTSPSSRPVDVAVGPGSISLSGRFQ